MDFKKYLEDYYLLKISMEEICKIENIKYDVFYKYLIKNNYTPRRKYYGMINTGNKDLDKELKGKCTNIVKRCNDRPSCTNGDVYKDKPYLPIFQWVEFCNKNKDLLLKLWKDYIESGKQIKLCISIDRIDETKGYILGNMEFVTQGFNCWKRNIRPIKVTFSNKDNYFMSCEEGSRYYDIGRTYIGKVLNKSEYYDKRFEVSLCDIEDVLHNKQVKDIKEYYQNIFQN